MAIFISCRSIRNDHSWGIYKTYTFRLKYGRLESIHQKIP